MTSTPEWISRSVSRLRSSTAKKAEKVEKVADSADKNAEKSAGKAAEKVVEKVVEKAAEKAIEKAAKPTAPRTTHERLQATLRRGQEALAPRALRRVLTDLQAVIKPRTSELEGGRRETYEVDYGPLLSYTPKAKLSTASKLPEMYKLLRDMELTVKQAGLGGNVEFWAGTDVVSVLLGIVEGYTSTTESKPYRVQLEQGKINVGSYVINFMDETYPNPSDETDWLPKLDPKTLVAVATNHPGTVWYCAIDSISANNAATPLHIVPVARDDDSGVTLIGQAKPLPARPSRASCKSVVVD